ncbi:MAG: MFS transporter, partial [Actinomycetia bacterium]|nr:MFS transporter [Actinomycetes bacterium]
MSQATAVPAPPMSKRARYFALAAMVFVTSMTFIDMTIVTIAAPDIEKELGISDEALQWVINGYLLGLAATFAFWGRVADVAGHRKMAIIGTLVFVIASTMCGLTPDGDIASAWIIGFRIIQGVGAAMLFPAALAIVVASFPVSERGRALAIFFAITGGFTAIGPIAGGYLTEWTWRSIFWINIPIAIVAIILTAKCQTTLQPKKEPIDYRGAVIIIVGMALSIIGVQQAGVWGWTSPWTIGAIVLGLVVLAIFVRFELGV